MLSWVLLPFMGSWLYIHLLGVYVIGSVYTQEVVHDISDAEMTVLEEFPGGHQVRVCVCVCVCVCGVCAQV